MFRFRMTPLHRAGAAQQDMRQGIKDKPRNRQRMIWSHWQPHSQSPPWPETGCDWAGSSQRPATAATWCFHHLRLLGLWLRLANGPQKTLVSGRAQSWTLAALPGARYSENPLCSARSKLNIRCPRAGKLSCPSGKKEKAKFQRKIPSPKKEQMQATATCCWKSAKSQEFF